MTTAETLRGLPYFADLPMDLLERVAAGSEACVLEPGEVIIEEGSESNEMYVVVDGELSVTKRTGPDREVVLAKIVSGEVVGEIALLDKAQRTATVTADVRSNVIRVPADAFEELLSDASVVRRMFRTVTSRLRGIEDTLRHEERMAALGRMAAQLMHELNNPAAAVGRSSSELESVYLDLNDEAEFLAMSLGNHMQIARPEPAENLRPLEIGEREDDLTDLLEDWGLEDGFELAPGMVAAGWTRDELEKAIDVGDETLRNHLARWIGLRATAGQLIGEITMASGRVSELVRVVKEYSYLDQAPVQEVLVTSGIKDTLILLKHKLKEVAVTTEFPEDLRMVQVPGRDLNQVWTNLIDNAADAMDYQGELHIEAANIGAGVQVSVADTGPGMSPETVERIFDPFFTTKEPGKGTGLGLHTVHTIINRIGGDIDVESSPKGTTFTVTLPVEPS